MQRRTCRACTAMLSRGTSPQVCSQASSSTSVALHCEVDNSLYSARASASGSSEKRAPCLLLHVEETFQEECFPPLARFAHLLYTANLRSRFTARGRPLLAQKTNPGRVTPLSTGGAHAMCVVLCISLAPPVSLPRATCTPFLTLHNGAADGPSPARRAHPHGRVRAPLPPSRYTHSSADGPSPARNADPTGRFAGAAAASAAERREVAAEEGGGRAAEEERYAVERAEEVRSSPAPIHRRAHQKIPPIRVRLLTGRGVRHLWFVERSFPWHRVCS